MPTLRVLADEDVSQELALTLDEICRRGAERMLAIALEAEVDAYLGTAPGRPGRARPRPGGAKRPRPTPEPGRGSRCTRGEGTAGGRPLGRREHREAVSVPKRDPAAVRPPLPEGGRGAAASVPARAFLQGLRAGAGGVLRVAGGAVGGGDHQTHQELVRR